MSSKSYTTQIDQGLSLAEENKGFIASGGAQVVTDQARAIGDHSWLNESVNLSGSGVYNSDASIAAFLDAIGSEGDRAERLTLEAMQNMSQMAVDTSQGILDMLAANAEQEERQQDDLTDRIIEESGGTPEAYKWLPLVALLVVGFFIWKG